MISLAIRVARADAELVLAELLAIVPSGMEERDADDGTVEYILYGAPGELPALPDLQATVGGALVSVSTSELPDDWSERWRQFHQPALIEAPAAANDHGGPGAGPARVPALHVRPPWCEPSHRTDALEIVIDPGQAFGTGAHATTRLCLELLLEVSATGVRGELIDVGTGSGVLAIAARLLGFGPVRALDNDRASVVACAENAATAAVDLAIAQFDLRSDVCSWDAAPVITANLVRPLLVEFAGALPAAPAHLLASGLLLDEVDSVARVFADRLGLCERQRRHSGEWAALWLSAPTTAVSPP